MGNWEIQTKIREIQTKNENYYFRLIRGIQIKIRRNPNKKTAKSELKSGLAILAANLCPKRFYNIMV
jgi:hypothetical protein